MVLKYKADLSTGKLMLILIVIGMLIPLNGGNDLNAQPFDFNARIVQDYIYSMHLYRDKLLQDRYRPIYHFVIPEGMAHPFDPNGAIYWNDRYHLFYIFQQYRPREGHRGDAWAHISSHDLVHWRFHPTALRPTDDSPEVAIYSGNTFIDKNGVPTIIYQGLGAGQCIAFAQDDNLDLWKKSDANPVIPYPEYPVDNDNAVFRSILDTLPVWGRYDVWDPHAWLDGDTYYAISGDNDLWPAEQSTLWKSTDLENWELVGDFFHHGEPEGVLDCPDFFMLDDKWVLIYLGNGLDYVIGDFKDEQFHPEKYGTMTWKSGVGYAPESLLDAKGRRIMWAGIYDSRTQWGGVDDEALKHAWDGTMTLPRVLNLDEDNNLLMEPVEELQSLRTNQIIIEDLDIDDTEITLDNITGDALELAVEINPGDAKQFGLKLLASPGGEEETVLYYDTEKQIVRMDFSKSSLDPELVSYRYRENNFEQVAELPLEENEMVNLHIFIDRSVMEIFINNRLCLTHSIYPSREDSRQVKIFSMGGSIEVPVIYAWEMFPSNPY